MKTCSNQLFVVGLNYRKTPLEKREKWSIPSGKLPAAIQELRAQCGLKEAVVLNTCNRLEIYGLAPGTPVEPRHLLRALAGRIGNPLEESDLDAAEQFLYCLDGEACVHHLFRVASSLDSLVVGETEIVGQVKRAYQEAQACGATGNALNRLFQTALSISKQVRTRSGIGRCSTSVGAVSLDLAEKIFGEDLSQRTILVIGAGKMGETTLRHLAKRGAKSVLVANRSFDRAQELASEFQGQAIPFAQLLPAMSQADIVISSTSAPQPIISRQDLASLRPERAKRTLLMVDLAVPRDIDPRVLDLDGVYLYNIDQLAEIARVNLEHRRAEAALCEKLVLERAQELAARLLPAQSPGERPERALTRLLAQASCLCGSESPAPAF